MAQISQPLRATREQFGAQQQVQEPTTNDARALPARAESLHSQPGQTRPLPIVDEHHTAVMADLYKRLQDAQVHLREQLQTNYALQDTLRKTEEEKRAAQLAEQKARSEAARHQQHRKTEAQARAKEQRVHRQRTESAEQRSEEAEIVIAELKKQIVRMQEELAAAEHRAQLAEEGTAPVSEGRLRKLHWQIEQERRETRQRERAGNAILAAERKSVEARMRELEAAHQSRKQALQLKSRALDEMTERAEREMRRAQAAEAQIEDLRQQQSREAAERQATSHHTPWQGNLKAHEALLQARAEASLQVLEAERRAYNAESARRGLEDQLATARQQLQVDEPGRMQQMSPPAHHTMKAMPASSLISERWKYFSEEPSARATRPHFTGDDLHQHV